VFAAVLLEFAESERFEWDGTGGDGVEVDADADVDVDIDVDVGDVSVDDALRPRYLTLRLELAVEPGEYEIKEGMDMTSNDLLVATEVSSPCSFSWSDGTP